MRQEGAHDVAQDVFGAVAQGIPGFRRTPPEDTIRGWHRTITRNKLIDHARRQARQQVAAGGTEAIDRRHQIAAERGVSE